ncbi:hypothetical protein ABKN59_003150 [Abortiporus biennis]
MSCLQALRLLFQPFRATRKQDLNLSEKQGDIFSKQATVPSLPQNIIDRIIDFLHDDRYSLKSCSLVSRSWLDTSRYHLYGVMTITAGKRDKSCKKRRKRNKHNKRPILCSHLLAQYLSKFPSLRSVQLEECRFVHKFDGPILAWIKSILPVKKSTSRPRRGSCSYEQQPTPVDKFPISIEKLSIGCVGSSKDPLSPDFNEILSLFSTVTHLGVYAVEKFTPTQTPATSPTSPNQQEPQHLLPPPIESSSSATTSTSHRSFFQEHALECQSSSMRFSPITPDGAFQTLQDLFVTCSTLNEYNALGMMLAEVKDHIRVFGFNPQFLHREHHHTGESVDYSILNLASCINLRHLELFLDFVDMKSHNPIGFDDGTADLICDYPNRILSNFPTSVRSINFQLYLREEDADAFNSTMDWEELDHMLYTCFHVSHVSFRRRKTWYASTKMVPLEECGILEGFSKLNSFPGLLSIG